MIFLADVMDLHLQVMQLRITAALADQLVVRAVLDDAAALEGDDAIDTADGRKAVGDDEHGPTLDDPPHIVLDDALALVIESARRLVEDQNSRIHDEGAGDGDPLLLPAREAAASLADDGVITFGQFQDEVVRAGERGGGDDTLHRHRRIGERNIVAHRGVEQHVFLQHDSDLPAQPGNIRYGEIDAIDRDPPALRHIETLDKLGERALARTRRTDDAHHLARRYVEADVVPHLGAVDAVPEGDMLEDDVDADRRQCSPRGAERRFRHGVEDIAQPGNRQAGLVEILPNLRQAQHWGADATRKNVEGHELPDGEAAVNDELCPVDPFRVLRRSDRSCGPVRLTGDIAPTLGVRVGSNRLRQGSEVMRTAMIRLGVAVVIVIGAGLSTRADPPALLSACAEVIQKGQWDEAIA